MITSLLFLLEKIHVKDGEAKEDKSVEVISWFDWIEDNILKILKSIEFFEYYFEGRVQ